MNNSRIRVSPDICTYVDEDHTKLGIDAVIPGVRREDVSIKIHQDSMYLRVPRE